ncbi:YlbL family protein [Nesterenkonia natronophila]|uniref:Signal protein PDZ n=1 Tax=Nesterenkonia natronophila TaxID=2174932 RepID=A0A3A4F1T5_9MICC|nr:S16 family serine protease [Nesterenkonia natronophila]RJN31778.1 signal protein PDZ [Nesterenkonia natronophila]
MTLRRTVQTLAGAGALVAGLGALALPSAYLLESPGPIFDTISEIDDQPVITVDGASTYETDGTLALTTVYVNGAPTSTVRVPDAIRGWLSPSVDMTPHELIYPSGTTEEEVRDLNTAAMASSQELALAAALDYLGVDYAVELSIMEFTEEAIAAGTHEALAAGDILLNAGGEEITGIEGLRQAVNDAAGEPIELTLVRDGEHVEVEAPTYQEADGEYYVGILLGSEFEFPVQADIQLEEVGGPSAGLMFALGIIDTMTQESLTGGEDWAGTGTVDPDGKVGAIGGIAQKVAGARSQGAEYFLAPRDNCDELEGRLPNDLEVYGVDDADEAVEVLEAVRDGDESFLAGLSPCGR